MKISTLKQALCKPNKTILLTLHIFLKVRRNSLLSYRTDGKYVRSLFVILVNDEERYRLTSNGMF